MSQPRPKKRGSATAKIGDIDAIEKYEAEMKKKMEEEAAAQKQTGAEEQGQFVFSDTNSSNSKK